MLLKKDKKKILFFKEALFKIAELLFTKPNSTFHIRGLAKETGFSTTAITKSIKELEQQNLITVEKTAITTNIRSNIESKKYQFYKKILNLYRIEQYNLLELLQKTYRAKTIVLFGSFARGEDIEGSDIDFLIITNKREKINLSKYEKIFQRKINLHVVSSLNKSTNEFKNGIANGVILHGYLKVV